MKAQEFEDLFGVKHPIIMAPMFLVSNTKMLIEGLKAGITGAIPALNYRTAAEMEAAIQEIKQATDTPFGINLIVNKSNPKLQQQLNVLQKNPVHFVIASLGNPKPVIDVCKPLGIRVICDVVNLKQAQKVERLGADAVIAVCNRTGGHLGKLSKEELIGEIRQHCSLPLIAAGGVTSKQDVEAAMQMGAIGVSVGTLFIASDECGVNQEYKQAILDYGAKDIVITTKMSGSALTVINTPYVQEIGTRGTPLELLMNKVRPLKKFVKMLIAIKGMKTLEKAAFKASYKTVWVAGYSVENIHSIRPVRDIVASLIE